MGPRVHSCCHLGMVMDFLPGETLEEARFWWMVVGDDAVMVNLPTGSMGLVYLLTFTTKINHM